MNTLTPSQQNQLRTWAEQRDAMLTVLSDGRKELEALTRKNQGLRDSNTELDTNIVQKKGMLLLLEEQNNNRVLTLSSECVDLEKRKTRLETIVGNYEKDIPKLEEKKSTLIADIGTLSALHDKIFERAGSLDKVVDRVVRVSEQNISTVSSFVEGVKENVKTLSDSFEEKVNTGMIRIAEVATVVESIANTSRENTNQVSEMIDTLQGSNLIKDIAH